MANLVTPGYNKSSLINEILSPYEERTVEFRGLNRKSAVEEGEMSDMLNLTSDDYPLLAPRKLRGTYALPEGVKKPLSIITKFDRIAMIAQKDDDSIAFFYDGTEVASVTGLTEDTQMVAINTKICFFPQKTYVSLIRTASSVTIDSTGSLEASKSVTDGAVTITNTNVSLTVGSGHGIAKGDAIDITGTMKFGNEYVYTSTGTKKSVCTQPDGTGGDILFSSTGIKFVGIQQEGKSDFWIVAASDGLQPFTLESYRQDTGTLEYTALATTRNGHWAAWIRWHDPKPTPTIKCFKVLSSANPIDVGINLILGASVNVSCTVNNASTSVLTLPRETFIELTGSRATDATFTGTVKREMPNLKYVTEWNNRLWGVSDADNTVYACKLGDPKNWKYYQGTSLDSYYAQQGTDGNWTGSAVYSGHIIFFKPGSMTRIYGTSPSTFQVNNMVCYGIEEGSSKSAVTINDVVLYKSSEGIMAYEGGTPYSISSKLKSDFKNVVAGTDGRKYYASIENDDETHELLVLDVERAVWHKEDDVRFRDCCTHNEKLYFISDADTASFEADKIYIINPEEPTETLRQREWMATFGDFDETVEGKKIFSKISIRFVTHPSTVVTIYIRMDGGSWERIRQIGYVETGGITVPIVPRRCDRFAIKIVGKGECEIKSLTRRYRRGSDK